METNFQIKVATEDIDKELRSYLHDKLRHIATEEAKELVDEKFNEFISEKISKRFDELVESKPCAFRLQVEEVVAHEIRNQIPSYSELGKMVKEEIDEKLAGVNIQLIIKNILKDEIEKVVLDTLKERVIEALK